MSARRNDPIGDGSVGVRPPTMSDVAARVGVSRQLVSLVMRGSPGPSPQTRERVLEAASALGYRGHASARILRQKRSYLIGALFSMRNPFESNLVEALFNRAVHLNYGLVLAPVTDARPAEVVAGEILEQRVEALIGLVPTPWTDALSHLSDIVPMVWLGGPVTGTDNVHVDNVSGMRAAVGHLMSAGHRHIAHLRGTDGSAGRERARAYGVVMAEAGLGEFAETLGFGWSEEVGARVADELLARTRRPTAIICANDGTAAGLISVLRIRGLRVPEDLSVIGWDDSYVARLSYLDLTSVRQEIETTAELALDLAIRRIEDPSVDVETVLTPATLIVRATTGPAPKAQR